MNNVIATIKTRRSIRKFNPEQIRDEELQAIIEAGLHAATGHNDQPWFFTVIRNQEVMQRLSDKAKELMSTSETPWIAKIGRSDRHILYKAPCVILVSGRKDAYSPLTDCAAAIQNMLVAAESLKIGSVWVGLIDYVFAVSEEVEKLKVPAGYQPYYAVCLGYSSEESKPTAPERRRDVMAYID